MWRLFYQDRMNLSSNVDLSEVQGRTNRVIEPYKSYGDGT